MAMLRQALKLRSSWALRIFVLSDAEGWADWQQAVEELRTEVSLEGVSFEAVHFERSPQFQAYLRKYPAECMFQNAVERAMLARVLCHELLPNDISHVISMDLGDVLILEDLWHLWVLQEESSSTSLLQASLAGALHHVNAGVVLYHTARMREANFTDLSLQAAHAAFEQGKQHAASLECPRDQAILNQLHEDGTAVIGFLPCRWSLFPVVDWHPAFLSRTETRALWRPELFERLRYPGLLAAEHVEFHCPEAAELLAAFAFLPGSEKGPGKVQQLAALAEAAARPEVRHGCACGERASLAHVAGDLKAWPAMRRFLAAGRPGLEEEEGLPSPSRQWWGGAARSSRLREQSQQQLFLMAKQQGLDYVTQVGASWCHTMWTTPRVYHAARLEVTKEDQLEIETTAARLRVRLTPLTPTASAALEVTLRTADLTLDVASDGDAAGRHRLSWSACLEREWVLTRWRLSASLVELCGASLHLNASLGFPLGLWVASESESARWAVCVKRKWARHLLVLLGIVLLVFVFDSLVFGSVPLSLKQFQWSACDLVISFLLGACALQAYLLKRKSPEARTEKEEKENGNGKPPAKTMSNINRELDRVSQQGAKQVEAQGRQAVLRKFEGVPGALDALSCSAQLSAPAFAWDGWACYNLVIRAHAKEGNHKRAGEWIMRMEAMKANLKVCFDQERGIKVCSYNTQLDACAKAQNAEACERWLQRMLDQAEPKIRFRRRGGGSRLDVRSRRGGSSGWWPWAWSRTRKGNLEEAEAWMEEMQQKGLEPSVTTFGALIDAAAKAGDLDKAELWMRDMLHRGIEPSVVSFGAVMNACAKASSLERAEFWHQEMIEAKVKPNVRCYGAIINACAKVGQAERAEKWLLQLEASGLRGDAIVYSSVIDACGKAGDCEKALEVFKRMRSRGVSPHGVTYASLAKPFAYRGHWEVVEELGANMQEQGLAPNEYLVYMSFR
ncbi:unnamed protein product [Effrenium voratum]|nr:unnamed protein product [Effrenium voratum]